MRKPLVIVAACAALVATAGCGGSAEKQAESKPPSSATSPAAAKANRPEDQPTPTGQSGSGGKMTPSYEDAQTPEAQRGRQLMMDAKFLEDVSQQVNDDLILPIDVPVIGKQCDTANAYWSPENKTISICYEDVAHSEQMFIRSKDPTPVAAAINSEISTFFHELGHATLNIYDLAFTGREEDVADQLSAFMLLDPGADGKPYPNGVQIATDAARMWKLNSHETGDPNDLPFWDVHSFDLTRMYNWECWIYGSNPAANGEIVSDGDLPEDRASSCEGEFQNLSRAWHEMLGPHLRKEN